MWTTSATQMIVRVTGSGLFSNPNLTSLVAYDHRSYATTSQETPEGQVSSSNAVARLSELRPTSPYSLFVKTHYGEMSKKFPDLRMTDIGKKLSQAWKNLPINEKQNYTKLVQDQRTIYAQEKTRLSAADLQKIDDAEKSRKLASRIKKNLKLLPTKKPRLPFTHFLASIDRGNAELKDFVKAAARLWSQLPEQDKQKFRDLYVEEKRQYHEALARWVTKAKPVSETKPQPTPSSNSPTKKNDEVKKRSKSEESTKKVAKTAPKEALKSSEKKSTKKSSDEEKSSSEDEAPPKTKLTTKTEDKKQ